MEPNKATYDEINTSFRKGDFRALSDEKLLAYLNVLCHEQVLSSANQLLSNNRCISINAELMNRYYKRSSRATGWLTVFGVILALGQFVLAVLAWKHGAQP